MSGYEYEWQQRANEGIAYTDVEKLKAALVGRSIVSTVDTPGSDYDGFVEFFLDDGSKLVAHETHGGCACSNGCFSVTAVNNIVGTITNVEVSESTSEYDYETRQSTEREVEPGSISDGSATIRIYVYTALNVLTGKDDPAHPAMTAEQRQTLVESEGGDNGYYGWGFWLHVEAPPAKDEIALG